MSHNVEKGSAFLYSQSSHKSWHLLWELFVFIFGIFILSQRDTILMFAPTWSSSSWRMSKNPAHWLQGQFRLGVWSEPIWEFPQFSSCLLSTLMTCWLSFDKSTFWWGQAIAPKCFWPQCWLLLGWRPEQLWSRKSPLNSAQGWHTWRNIFPLLPSLWWSPWLHSPNWNAWQIPSFAGTKHLARGFKQLIVKKFSARFDHRSLTDVVESKMKSFYVWSNP